MKTERKVVVVGEDSEEGGSGECAARKKWKTVGLWPVGRRKEVVGDG